MIGAAGVPRAAPRFFYGYGPLPQASETCSPALSLGEEMGHIRAVKLKRIISLTPGGTEIVAALGAAGQLVGRSAECDFPAAITALPVCSATPTGAGARRQLDARKLLALQPDLILTGAPDEPLSAEVAAAVGGLAGQRPQILALAPRRMVQIWETFYLVAEALAMAEIGREVVRPLKLRVVDIIEKACVVAGRPTVACLDGGDPLRAAGNWVPELVELAGGENRFGAPGGTALPLDWEALRAGDPELIVLLPAGGELGGARLELLALASLPGWTKLRAVRKGRVYLTDGSHFFSRPGPRIVEALEVMAELCHPDRFNFGHRGKAWEKF